MQKFLLFADLKAKKIVNNRPSLKNRIEKHGFPPGRKIGPNTRAWTEEEIEAYLASRPTAPKPAPPPPKSLGRPRGRPPRRSATDAAVPNPWLTVVLGTGPDGAASEQIGQVLHRADGFMALHADGREIALCPSMSDAIGAIANADAHRRRGAVESVQEGA